ncbi:MAG TPA: MFS transporter [Acidimicrobiales bacterium]|nr:MFS transporter [Acidimicrobiales bacterium]
MADAPTDAVARQTWLRVTIALFLVAMIAGFAQFGAVASLADVARHFGHHTSSQSLQSVVGLSGSVLGIGLAILRFASLGALPLASLADRWGRTNVLRRALLVGLVVTACASLSPSYWFFVLCFALARPVLSTTSVLVQVITVELSSTKGRIDRLVIISAGAGIGAGLAAVFHGIIRGSASFRWLFALAVVPVFFVRPLLRHIPEPAFQRGETAFARLGAVPRGVRARVAIVGVMVFIVGVISGPASGFTFVYGEGVLKISPGVMAMVVTLSAVTGLVGLLLSRYCSRVFGRRWTIAFGTIATALTASLAYGGGKTAFIVGYMSGVAAGGLLAPALVALSTELFSHSFRATAAGWIVVAGVLGAMTGLLVFGLIGDVVHVTGAGSFRLPALFTFVPLLPALFMLTRLPESSGMDLT